MAPAAAIDFVTLCKELEALIEAPPARDRCGSARVERTLTDGYASAMQLEAERTRIERRIGAVAAQVSLERRGAKTEELADLSLRLSQTAGDLEHLRKLLAVARSRATTAA